jgi:hypothetical protein
MYAHSGGVNPSIVLRTIRETGDSEATSNMAAAVRFVKPEVARFKTSSPASNTADSMKLWPFGKGKKFRLQGGKIKAT